MNPDDTITTGWEQKTDKSSCRFYEKLPDYFLPPDQDFEKGWVRWIHPRLSADYSAQQTEMLNLQHHTMRLEQHEQMNTHDPTRFSFFAYCALEERLATYIYSIKEKVQKDDKRPSWPFGPPHMKPSSTLLPCHMAGAGWVCLPQERRTPDLVVCHKCGVEKSGWKEGDCPRKVHEQLSPSCTFSFENTEEVLRPYSPFPRGSEEERCFMQSYLQNRTQLCSLRSQHLPPDLNNAAPASASAAPEADVRKRTPISIFSFFPCIPFSSSSSKSPTSGKETKTETRKQEEKRTHEKNAITEQEEDGQGKASMRQQLAEVIGSIKDLTGDKSIKNLPGEVSTTGVPTYYRTHVKNGAQSDYTYELVPRPSDLRKYRSLINFTRTYEGTLLADVCTVKIPKKAEAMQVMVELALTGKDMAEEPKRTSIKYIGGSSMLDTQELQGVLDFDETVSFHKLAGHSHLRISLWCIDDKAVKADTIDTERHPKPVCQSWSTLVKLNARTPLSHDYPCADKDGICGTVTVVLYTGLYQTGRGRC
jgi:hypothetical protein